MQAKARNVLALGLVALLTSGASSAASAQKGPDAADQPRTWQHFPLPARPPEGAPNILIVLTDDVGFGTASSFGGLVETPTFDAVGAAGIRLNGFHTTAMCSPTRAALLTGRNHHAVGNGAIANFARDLDGYTSAIPDSAATIADVLRAHGYSTSFFGKNHNTPEWESGSMGPFDRWPTGLGFDYFYGFNGPLTDQFAPELVENTTQVEPARDPGYTLDRDLSDHAIEWLRRHQNSNAADRPFFLYIAPGSPHTPNQVPADWIARYRGKFDLGWDEARERIFERQKALGVIPADAVLTPRPPQLPAWNSLSADEKRVAARIMEVFAAQLAHSDYQIGRIVEELRRTGEYDNTLIVFIQGDNGSDLASLNGADNEWGGFLGEEPGLAEMLPRLDRLGGPETFVSAPAGWMWATNTPFQWGKSMAGHLGGIRSGAAISWPNGIARRGEIASDFTHLVDIAPTIYEIVGIVPPSEFEGVEQLPIDGTSLAPLLRGQARLPSSRGQYFEMMGNLGYYDDGWFIGTGLARAPWDRTSPRTPLPEQLSDFAWELYDLRSDFSQSENLAARHPDKLREMIAGFAAAAERNGVLPVENDFRLLIDPSNRPAALARDGSYLYSRSDVRYVAADLPNLRGPWRLSARVLVPTGKAAGPVFVQGGRFSGWGLLLDEGKPVFVNKPSFDVGKYGRVAGRTALAPGARTIDVDVTPEPSVAPHAARVTIMVDGTRVAEQVIPDSRVLPNPAYLGRYGLTPLIDDAAIPPRCECEVESVRLTLLR